MAIVVVLAVQAGEAAQVGSCLVGRDGALSISGDDSTIVIQG